MHTFAEHLSRDIFELALEFVEQIIDCGVELALRTGVLDLVSGFGVGLSIFHTD